MSGPAHIAAAMVSVSLVGASLYADAALSCDLATSWGAVAGLWLILHAVLLITRGRAEGVNR